MIRRYNNQKGLTLIELIIALAISSLALVGVYQTYDSQIKANRVQENVLGIQQNVRAALYFMTSELRLAGLDKTNKNDVSITEAKSNSITFSFVAYDDNDGTTDEANEISEIQYTMGDGDGDGETDDIMRSEAGQAATLANNIEAIEFYYELADGSHSLSPSNPDNIRSVEIAILGRANDIDPDFADLTRTYTTPSGRVWGPYNGNTRGYRRYYFATRIKCRNMGI